MSPQGVGALERIDRGVLGARIRRYRRAARLRQSELGEVAGVTAAYLSRIESGARRPSPAVLEHIASRLDLDVDELLVDHVDDVDHESEAAAARAVAGAVSRWLGNPGDVGRYDEMIRAVRRWEGATKDVSGTAVLANR